MTRFRSKLLFALVLLGVVYPGILVLRDSIPPEERVPEASGAGRAAEVLQPPHCHEDRLSDCKPESAGGAEAPVADGEGDCRRERELAGALADFRELWWSTFAHPAILERRQNGRILHQVANHLIVTTGSPEAVIALQQWADTAQGNFLDPIAADTYLVGWEAASARAYVENKTGIRSLLGDAAVVEPNWIVRADATPPGDRYSSQQPNFRLMFAEAGWAVRTDAEHIVVAVVDSGVDYTHPDLATRVRPRPGEIPDTGRDDDGNGYVDDVYGWDFVENTNTPTDRTGHGTHVAGIIGADGTNTLFGVGVAWNVTLLPVRFLDDEERGTNANQIKALDYARVSGARIVNASYGGGDYSHAVLQRIQALDSAGIWFVSSAGNDGQDIDLHPNYPGSYNVPNVIAVAALDSGGLWPESNFGVHTVDLAAPGRRVYSTDLNGGFTHRTGTSMAAAFVSGALALLLAEYPDATAAEIRSRLVDRSRHSPSLVAATRSSGSLDLGHALAPGPGRAPTAWIWPESVFGAEGEELELMAFTTSAAGTAGQWLRNGEPIPGETQFLLRIHSMSAELEGEYRFRVRDLFGEALSDPVPVYLRSRIPVITAAPPATVSFGFAGSVSLHVAAHSTEPLSHQWYFNGSPIPGAVSARLDLAGMTHEHAGDYFLRLSTPFGVVDSSIVKVAYDPYGGLQWSAYHVFPPKVDRREGAYYLASRADQRIFSGDLVVWAPLPHNGVDLFHLRGEYFLVDDRSSIYRGADIASVALWRTADDPDAGLRPKVFIRANERLLIYWANPNFTTIRRIDSIDLATGEGVAAPTTSSAATPAAMDGAFWRKPSGYPVERSADGVEWAPVPDEVILPIRQDEETGWTSGWRQPKKDQLYIRAPGGSWQPLMQPTSYSPIPVSVDWLRGHFPGGLLLGDATSPASHWVMDYRTGTLKPFEGGFGKPLRTSHTQVFWRDHDRALRRDPAERGGLLVKEEFPTGDESVVLPGRVSPDLRYAGDAFFSLDGRGFFFYNDSNQRETRLYSVDRQCGLRPLHAHREKLTLRGSNGRVALLSEPVLYHASRIFRMDGAGELVEISHLFQEDQRNVWARGQSFFAQTGSTGMPWDLTSADAISWRGRGDLPANVTVVAANNHALFAQETVALEGQEKYLVRIYRRMVASVSLSWDVVLEIESAGWPSRLFANPGHVFFRADGIIHSSRDGSSWDTSPAPADMMFGHPDSLLVHQSQVLANGWFVSKPWNVDVTQASATGAAWFPYVHGNSPGLITGEAAFRIRGWLLESARWDGGPPDRALPVVIPGSLAAAGTSGQWLVHALPEDAEEISVMEVFRDGRPAMTTSPSAFPIRIEEQRPGVYTYRIEALYKDGSRAYSDDITFRVPSGRMHEMQQIPVLNQTDPLKLKFFPSRNGFFAYLAAGVHPLFHIEDGDSWRMLSYALGNISYVSVLEPSEGLPVIVNSNTNGNPWLAMRVGETVGARVDKPPGTSGDFALFLHDEAVHLLSRRGALYRMTSGGDWEASRVLDFFPPQTTGHGHLQSRVTVLSGRTLHAVLLGPTDASEGPFGYRFLTRDFETHHPIPEIPGYVFQALWPDADELVYLAEDGRRLLITDEQGAPTGTISFPVAATKLSFLPGQTVVAESSAGAHAFLATRTGRVSPIRTGLAPQPTYLRDATRLGVFGENGDYYFLALQDFHVAFGAQPEVIYGPLNRLRSSVRLRHDGALSTGAAVELSVHGWLEPVGGSGPEIHLGEHKVDASHFQPGQSRSIVLDWELAADIGAADYRLVIRANGDDAVASSHPGGRSALSSLFTYHPHPALAVADSAFGWVETAPEGERFAYGSILQLRAHADEGFVFMEWEGLAGNNSAELTLLLDASYAIRARFLHASLTGAFPDLRAVPEGPWFANESGLLFAAVTGDWSYHCDLGWFALGDSTADGAWLWFAGHGWLFRTKWAECYFDPRSGEWSWLPGAD